MRQTFLLRMLPILAVVLPIAATPAAAGKFTPADIEQAKTVVPGSFTATGQTGSEAFSGTFNWTVSGTFVGQVQPERSFDGGATWRPLTALGVPIIYTGAATETFDEPEPGVRYRANVTSYTSGTIVVRISK